MFSLNGGVIGKQQYPSNIGLEYRANYVYESTAVSSVTFSNADLGTPSPNRCIIVAIGARNSSVTISGCTIGGVTAYIVRSWVDGVATAALAIARVPTGTTGDIVVSVARHQTGGLTTTATCYIGVWAVKNLPHIHPMDLGIEGGGGAVTESITLRTSRNGFCIMIAVNSAGGNGPEGATTFSANLTKRFDGETSPIQNVGLLAAADGLTDGTNMTFTVTAGDTGTAGAPVIAATWDCGDTGGIWHVNSLENTFI